MNDFDGVAPFYDALVRLVFGDTLLESQTHFLDLISEEDHVLIIGGGTGKILEVLPNCASLTYLEKSKEMIKRAKKRKSRQPVKFINEDFFKTDISSSYDKIIIPFFLDCFNHKQLDSVLNRLKSFLPKKGEIYVTDFSLPANHLLARAMYAFFRIVANLNGDTMLDLRRIVKESGFTLINEKYFFGDKIFSGIYRNL